MKKVLLIEDDEFIRDLVSAKLHKSSFAVLISDSAEDAEEMLHNNTPDLIVLDLELPKMQGLDFLKKLKQDNAHHDVPVIVFSNNDEPEIKEECQKLGTLSFFVKVSTDLDALVEEIDNILR